MGAVSPHHSPYQFGKVLVYVMLFDYRDCVCSATQSSLILWYSMDCSVPGSFVHGIFQARIQEWVAFPFSRGSSQSRDQTHSPALQAESLPSQPIRKPQCWPIKMSLEIFSVLQKFLKGLIKIHVSHSLNPWWNSLSYLVWIFIC